MSGLVPCRKMCVVTIKVYLSLYERYPMKSHTCSVFYKGSDKDLYSFLFREMDTCVFSEEKNVKAVTISVIKF